MRLLQRHTESKLVDVKQSLQREYEQRISILEQTCKGMIVLLQSSTTSTCSSSPAPPLSYHHHYPSFLGGYSSSLRCPSSSPSSISPSTILGVPAHSSVWPGELAAATMAPTTATRRGSWGGTASSTTTTTGPAAPLPHVDATPHANMSVATTSFLFSGGTTPTTQKSPLDTFLMSSSGFLR